MSDVTTVTVTDHPERERFEATTDDGTFAGLLAYHRHGDRLTLIHTVVPDELEGHGIASQLARTVLDGARSAGERVVVVCPFVRAFVRRHHDWDDLIVPAEPADLDPDA